jgi:molybdopterin molybdotransferase
MRIFTGAAMPEGGNAVVMQEHVDRDGLTISSNRAVAPGQHVRHRGEDLAASAMAVDRGQRLHPTTLALVSFLDRARVQVARAPKVTILCTGSELRRPGAPQRPFTIAESNSTTIALLAQQAGAVVHATRIIDDDQSRIEAAIVQALADSDVLVTIGGVSVGDYDFVRPALERADVVLDLYQVGIKPGKPITLGRRDNKVVVGLPGNPVSAVITFALFAMPLLRAMQGDRSAIPVPTWVPLGNPVKPDAKRTRVVLGNLIRHQTSSRFVAHANQTSGATIALGQTDGFVILEAALETAAAGTLQPFHRWTDL